jgi:hypothetical protein
MEIPDNVPEALVPHAPVQAIRGPAWLTPPPRIYRFKSGYGALTLDPVWWLDEYNCQWDTPPGFYFDGMSYPPLTRLIFRWDKWAQDTLRTATNHDKNYTLHDFYPEQWPDAQAKFDRDLLEGLKLEHPEGDHIKYIGVRIGGYTVWRQDGRHPLVAQWLGFVDYPEQLDAWIQAVMEKDKAA